MASTVTWDSLRDLAGFRAQNGCAISLYVDLDPSVTPTPGDFDTRVNALVDEIERSESARRPELTHEQKEGLRADVQRLRDFFAQEFEREGALGFGVFCAWLDNLWVPLPLSGRVPDAVKVNRSLYLAPLVSLVGRGEGALVVFVGRERGNLYRLRAGRLEELVEQTDDTPGRHDQGGWSQARYQRHIDKLVQDHLKEVAEHVDRAVRRLRGPRVVVVATEETRPEFESALSSEAKKHVIGWTSAEAHATPAELLQQVEPLLEEWRGEQETETVERWREESGRNGRAAAGWGPTLEAASDARVELLLYADGVDRPAWECPACGRVASEGGACPLDGTEMERRDEGLDLAVHQTLAHGGRTLALTQRQDLEPVEGIGALLRF
ncbi:MAG TPA: Vms1/Ankzf1 family peptidyl-tRNA hydrolase [Gaiellaceae bacterium]|nr:Vms1/Ankzf1 family peptidyl-tRNA hydrolase [Gaiellaceae bacterium]